MKNLLAGKIRHVIIDGFEYHAISSKIILTFNLFYTDLFHWETGEHNPHLTLHGSWTAQISNSTSNFETQNLTRQSCQR